MHLGKNLIDVKSLLYSKGRDGRPIYGTQDPAAVAPNDLANNYGRPLDPPTKLWCRWSLTSLAEVVIVERRRCVSKVQLIWRDFCLVTGQLDSEVSVQNLSTAISYHHHVLPSRCFSWFLKFFPHTYFDTELMDVFRMITWELLHTFKCFKDYEFRNQTNWTKSMF